MLSRLILVLIGLVLASGVAGWVMFKPDSDHPRRAFARKVVDALAANNWDRSAIKPFLCNDRPQDSVDKFSFDLYQEFDGIKAVGNIKLLPVVAAPAMAMDTFIPVLFNKRFSPFPAEMPDLIAYHATYLQLQTQKSAQGNWCLEGWGRNEIPVNLDQARDFLHYTGIYHQD
jgi:hypothetical protein